MKLVYQWPAPKQQRRLEVWLRNSGRRLVLPACLIVLCTSLVAWRAVQWSHSPFHPVTGPALPLAKCFVTVAEVCFALLFLPVSRNLVTWLRSTWVRHVVDLDQCLHFHKVLAIVGALCGCAHGICISIAYHSAHVLEGHSCGSCWWAWGSGWVLVALIAINYPFALCRGCGPASCRIGKALGSFGRFWFSHHVLILVFTPLLVVHSIPAAPKNAEGGELTASKAWLFIAVPVLIYALERLTRAVRNSALKPEILDSKLLPQDVLELTLSKPRGFRFTSGMYCFIKCPAVSSYEWHPFTITSAPQDAFLSLHIRRAGDWTAALQALAADKDGAVSSTDSQSEPSSVDLAVSTKTAVSSSTTAPGMQDKSHHAAPGSTAAAAWHLRQPAPVKSWSKSSSSTSAAARAMQTVLFKDAQGSSSGSLTEHSSLPDLFLDGPFGAPTQAWGDYGVVTLIGAGIGVTPMASVLRSLLHNLYAACCDSCGHINQRACAGIRQQKVYFHWVLRRAEGMDWLQQILETIAEADPHGRFELHVHFTLPQAGTSPAASTAMTEAGSSNRVQYSTGRPDFRTILSHIQASHAGEAVGVFFCGPPALGHLLRAECRQLNRQAIGGVCGTAVDVEENRGGAAQLHFYQEVF